MEKTKHILVCWVANVDHFCEITGLRLSFVNVAVPDRDVVLLLAQMVVICMQMGRKLNCVSLLTTCPISAHIPQGGKTHQVHH